MKLLCNLTSCTVTESESIIALIRSSSTSTEIRNYLVANPIFPIKKWLDISPPLRGNDNLYVFIRSLKFLVGGFIYLRD